MAGTLAVVPLANGCVVAAGFGQVDTGRFFGDVCGTNCCMEEVVVDRARISLGGTVVVEVAEGFPLVCFSGNVDVVVDVDADSPLGRFCDGPTVVVDDDADSPLGRFSGRVIVVVDDDAPSPLGRFSIAAVVDGDAALSLSCCSSTITVVVAAAVVVVAAHITQAVWTSSTNEEPVTDAAEQSQQTTMEQRLANGQFGQNGKKGRLKISKGGLIPWRRQTNTRPALQGRLNWPRRSNVMVAVGMSDTASAGTESRSPESRVC